MPHLQADDEEAGDELGQMALAQLRNVVGRLAMGRIRCPWRSMRCRDTQPGQVFRLPAGGTHPKFGADVPDDTEARLVVLGINHPYGKEPNSPAQLAAAALLENRGTAPRRYRNTVVFLAPDRQRLTDLEEAIRKFLAWNSILNE